ncbi:Flagellum attachment zone protein 14 [Trypanosoma cruzi]|uniref:Flagellum attachment zone protein 14 n=1 Tax=Trypanosoma cruzi TaxID=5693 RepID=A0A2V2WF91_TRYCR|nr:Flagellum attachment zone protein 14 [Trypanosoma cruzi]
MENFHWDEMGIATRDDPDPLWNGYFSRRCGSCGSATSFGDPRGSQCSMRLGSRFSCRSSVRGEGHTIDETRRKQRVIRYMQEERERAARSKLEREKHEDWMSIRALERGERMQYMTDEERTAFFQREAMEAERERAAAEEAARAALGRRYSARNPMPRAAKERRGVMEAATAVSNSHEASIAVNRAPVSYEVEHLQKKMAEIQRQEAELQFKLRRAQDDAAAARADAENARQMQRSAEENVLREVKRANDESALRKLAESRAESLEKRVEEMRKGVTEMEEEVQRMKREADKNMSMFRENEKQLASLREQLGDVREKNERLQDEHKQLRVEKNAVATRAKNPPPQSVEKPKPKAKKQQQQSTRTNASGGKFGPAGSNFSRRPLEAETNSSVDAWGEIQPLREQLERQSSALKRFSDENDELKTKLRDETEMRRKLEELSAQSLHPKDDSSLRRQLEQAEKEAERFRAEARAARQELDDARVNYGREITSLNAWCARLDAQCRRQMSELQDRAPRDELNTEPTRRKKDMQGGVGTAKAIADASYASDSASSKKIQAELSRMHTRMEESEDQKQNAIAKAESLGQKRGSPPLNEQHDKLGTQSHKDALFKINKEVGEGKDAVRGAIAAEGNKVELVQGAKGLLPEKMTPNEAKPLRAQVVEDASVGNGISSAVTNGLPNDAEMEEACKRTALLQQEMEGEGRAHVGDGSEDAARNARADKGTTAAVSEKVEKKKKAKCGC